MTTGVETIEVEPLAVNPFLDRLPGTVNGAVGERLKSASLPESADFVIVSVPKIGAVVEPDVKLPLIVATADRPLRGTATRMEAGPPRVTIEPKLAVREVEPV